MNTTLLKGTLDLLILRTLALQAMHGVAVAERIAHITGGAFHVKAGSLFPALHRLEECGWIAGEWRQSEAGRRVKCYVITAAGRRQLSREQASWQRIVVAMSQVLESS
jgi:transcriptional regulator